MRSIIDLRDVDSRVDAADELLTHRTNPARLRQAMDRLEEVDALLGEMLANEQVSTEMAQRLGHVRNDLGGHLRAASALDDIDMPDQAVAGLLQRGVAAARTKIDALKEFE